MTNTFRIGTRTIGEGYPTFVIAEAGLNHNGDFQLAKKLVMEAARSGVDAVKFQTIDASKLVTKKNAFALDFFKEHEFNATQWKELADLAKKVGIMFLSTPFDEQSADFLEKLGVPAFKIASGDLTHLPLLSHVAKKGKPMICSTGAGSMRQIKEAQEAVYRTGNKQLAVLHCISNYPTQPQEAHLEMIQVLHKSFHVPAGFSDHTIGFAIAIGAVALGARIIEKHFTLDNGLPGPDHRLSLNPKDMAVMVEAIRKVEVAVGPERTRRAGGEFFSHRPDEKEQFGARRTIVAATHIAKGAVIERNMLKIVRAGNKGLEPKFLDSLVGKKAKKDIEAETPMIKQYV